MEEKQTTEEEINAELSAYRAGIDAGKTFERLLNNSDFKLFLELYVDAFALSQINNVLNYKEEQRKNFLEQSVARSVFVNFINEIIDQGKKDSLNLELFQEQLMREESGREE